MRIWYIGYFVIVLIVFNACRGGAENNIEIQIPRGEIADLQKLPQDSTKYLPNKHKIPSSANTIKLKEHYLKQFFSPWHSKPNNDKKSIFWVKDTLSSSGGFSENLQIYTLEEKQAILKSMRLESYPSLKHKAIITTSTAVRAVPSTKPIYTKANGYPFDRWQNSLIFSGTPVLITHSSEDGRFLHIQSSFMYGWVEASSVARVSEAQIKSIEGSKLALVKAYTPISDNIQMYDKDTGQYAFEARIGQIIYASLNAKDAYMYFVRQPNGEAKIANAIAKKNTYFVPLAQSLEPQNVASLINAMMGQKYGWGGYLQNRDCSAFVRDIFASFGLHLPRNSKAQVFYYNNAFDISQLSSKEKERVIIEKATPFMTILWLQGHIMLYLGEYEGRAIVAHSAWSVKTGEKYENLLGGVVITSLYVGQERGKSDKTPLIIDRIEAFSDIYALSNRIVADSNKRTK